MRDDKLLFFNPLFKTGFFASTITPLLPAHDLPILQVLNFCAGAGFLGLWMFNSWIIWKRNDDDKKNS